jgi:tetratricopeptide (TPR) repeat protein
VHQAIAMRVSIFAAIAAVVLGVALAWNSPAKGAKNHRLVMPDAPTSAESFAQSRDRVLFLERRLSRDPDDIDLLNQLSALYLQRLRETGDFSDLELAKRASRRSLAIVPAVRNSAALKARAVAEFASHEFSAARDDARTLLTLDGSGTPYALLGDAFAELGDYRAAGDAYARLRGSVGNSDENVATRRARMALLTGENDAAKDALSTALAIEVGRSEPSRERVAWYCWQLGDASFFTGDYSTARSRYNDALAVYPGYFRALASSGRLDAAQANYQRAVAEYEQAIRALPDPTFVAELGDVYMLSEDRTSAEREYALVDVIGRLSTINGVMYNRQLSMFDADHDRKPAEAYRSAVREYSVRRDILGADAVAWTALKAGKVRTAKAAMREALRLGTKDPRLFYHAGMIARASGDRAEAKVMLERALRLCPGFDPLQSLTARKALAELERPN